MAYPCRVHCGDPIQAINYALGSTWVHVDPEASFPTTAKGTAWVVCRARTTASPGRHRADDTPEGDTP